MRYYTIELLKNLFFFSLLGLIIGLINPKLVIRWGRKRTRSRVLFTYGLAMIVFFILINVTGHPIEQERKGPTVAPAPTKEQKEQIKKHTTTSIEHIKTKKYKIIHTITNQRYDGGVTYYVLIEPIDLRYDKFKDNIKSIVREMVTAKGGKITIEFHDKIESLNISYKQYGDMSLNRPRNKEEEEIEAVHFIAAFSGQLKTYAYFNTLDFFTVAFSDHPLVGKYNEQIEFNP